MTGRHELDSPPGEVRASGRNQRWLLDYPTGTRPNAKSRRTASVDSPGRMPTIEGVHHELDAAADHLGGSRSGAHLYRGDRHVLRTGAAGFRLRILPRL